MRPPQNGNGRRSRPEERRPQPGHEREPQPEHQTHRTTSTPILTLPVRRRYVKRDTLNGEAVKVMASMALDDLLRFSPTSRREAAVAAMALMRAEAVYRDAQRLASDVACLNALIVQEQEGAGA